MQFYDNIDDFKRSIENTNNRTYIIQYLLDYGINTYGDPCISINEPNKLIEHIEYIMSHCETYNDTNNTSISYYETDLKLYDVNSKSGLSIKKSYTGENGLDRFLIKMWRKIVNRGASSTDVEQFLQFFAEDDFTRYTSRDDSCIAKYEFKDNLTYMYTKPMSVDEITEIITKLWDEEPVNYKIAIKD